MLVYIPGLMFSGHLMSHNVAYVDSNNIDCMVWDGLSHQGQRDNHGLMCREK